MRKRFQTGDRVRMIECKDPYSPVAAGTLGTIELIDALGTLHVAWSDGRRLGVCLDEDVVEKVSLMEELESAGGRCAAHCADERSFAAHIAEALSLVEEADVAALERDGAWVVRSSYVDKVHETRGARYSYVRAGRLSEVIHGADIKNGVDAWFREAGPDPSLLLIAHGQGCSSPRGSGLVVEAFECKLLTKSAVADFEERVEAGWSEQGEAPERMFFSTRDHQPLPLARQGDLCQDFGHGSSRNQAAMGMASGLGSVLSKKAAMASAGTL